MEFSSITNILLYISIFVLIYFFYKKYIEVSYVKSSIDNRQYIIRNKYEEFKSKETADILAQINQRVEKLIDYLKLSKEYTSKNLGEKLSKVYNPSVISEAAFDTRYTTFTIDKQDMHICLRTRDDHQRAYDINLLMYVVIHELAHMVNYDVSGNPIIGHGIEFQRLFNLLIKEAISADVYKYENYRETPKEYCGITINSSILS